MAWSKFTKPKVLKNKNGTARIVRASYSSLESGSWWDMRASVIKRDGGRCRVRKNGAACGAPAKEVHHVIPLSRGGSTTMSNLISICESCHKQRHNHINR
jgi:5-methylcytosine-specific restriction endonuclease McrA